MTNDQFSGKVALITGSTAGIGKGMAILLLSKGATVIINGRSKDSVDSCVNELKMNGNEKVFGISADLSRTDGIDAVISRVEELNLELDILIQNTGIFEAKPFVDISDDEWYNFFNVNVMSGVRLSRYFLPRMLSRNSGVILFVSSEAAVCPKPFMVHYSMTKTAQLSISRGLAEMTKGTRVRINCIQPGPTWTEGVEKYMEGFAKDRDISVTKAIKYYFTEVEPTSLIQRFLTVEEVANTAVFLCSDEASGISGRTMLCDGGIVRHII